MILLTKLFARVLIGPDYYEIVRNCLGVVTTSARRALVTWPRPLRVYVNLLIDSMKNNRIRATSYDFSWLNNIRFHSELANDIPFIVP